MTLRLIAKINRTFAIILAMGGSVSSQRNKTERYFYALTFELYFATIKFNLSLGNGILMSWQKCMSFLKCFNLQSENVIHFKQSSEIKGRTIISNE